MPGGKTALPLVMRITGGIAESAGLPYPRGGQPAGSGYGYPPVSVRIRPTPTYLQAACAQSWGKSLYWNAPVLGCRTKKRPADGFH